MTIMFLVQMPAQEMLIKEINQNLRKDSEALTHTYAVSGFLIVWEVGIFFFRSCY